MMTERLGVARWNILWPQGVKTAKTKAAEIRLAVIAESVRVFGFDHSSSIDRKTPRAALIVTASVPT